MLWYSLVAPRRGASNEYPQHMLSWRSKKNIMMIPPLSGYSETCVREPSLWLIFVVDVERWLSCKGTCHVILLAKLHDMYLYKTDTFSTSATI